MSRLTTAPCSILAGLAVLLLSGCGGPYDATASGVVTLQGSPLPRGTIAFIPDNPGPSAYGMTDANGSYVVRTGREEGLPAGAYSVTVAANEAPSGVASKDGGPLPMGKSLTPEWYRDPATSGLKYTVASGDNEININLTTMPPAGWKPPPPRRR